MTGHLNEDGVIINLKNENSEVPIINMDLHFVEIENY